MKERRDLKRAVARQDLHLHYQPIVDATTGKAVSAEALLRGREDDRREWNIADLAASAERTRQIFELEMLIIEQACKDATKWQRGTLPEMSVNLNVSALEFQNRDFLASLERATKAAGLDPARVNLEITETASIHDPYLAEKVMTELRKRGFHIWLDDFGTGHSSLAWLKWFPVEALKVPLALVGDILTDPRCETIIEGVIRIAKGLDMLVIAEGVENEEQLSLLQSQGVDLMQGFLFYKPLPLEELESTLRSSDL